MISAEATSYALIGEAAPSCHPLKLNFCYI